MTTPPISVKKTGTTGDKRLAKTAQVRCYSEKKLPGQLKELEHLKIESSARSHTEETVPLDYSKPRLGLR